MHGVDICQLALGPGSSVNELLIEVFNNQFLFHLSKSCFHDMQIRIFVSECCHWYCLQSTLLSTLTNTQSAAASYEFTTLTCIPGVIDYKGANIQLLDLPGIIEGASQGKGRGRQVRN